MIEAVLTGLRFGAIFLWAWIALRVLFESWDITKAPEETRERGWRYWRVNLLCMSFIVVCLFSPENILRANGYITEKTGYYMLTLGVAGLHACAYLVLIGLDVATGQRNKAWPAYAAITAVSLAYAMLRSGA